MTASSKSDPRPRHVAIATGTRADWGLLSPVARALAGRPDTAVSVIATNMHLMPRYGNTIDEIRADGFEPAATVAMDSDDDSAASRVKAMGRCMEGMADALGRLGPDLLVVLGDRYEMLATAAAAMMMRIPIVHIAGGEITEGAVDDAIRHAITKLSSLHLTATEAYRRRVIQLGEDPDLVINTGAIGVSNIMGTPAMSSDELSRSIDFDVDRSTLLVTYHPATLDTADPGERIDALLDALDRYPDYKVLITYPNNDPRGAVIIDHVDAYAAARPGRVKVVPSLGRKRYLSALRAVAAVVGNSSSGIVEVPSAGIPTVDIGIRQRGRIAAPSVIHCGDSADEISEAIATALSPRMRTIAAECVNPYHRPDTLALITDAIALTPLPKLHTKTFHDLQL